jgi:early secretory antigenic target protein ESAT-6
MAMQHSSRQATVNGISALGMALRGVDRIRKDVESTGGRLMAGYRGVDGGQFQNLLNRWQEQAGIIAKNLKDVQDELTNTMQKHGQTQQTTTNLVGNASQRSSAVFDALAG